jgi:hypothetical protein
MKQLLFISFLLLGGGELFGQNSAKLFSTDSLYIGNNATMSVWGNFYNATKTSSNCALLIDSLGTLKFYGDTFQNIGASAICGNGSLEMVNPRPAPYASSKDQVFIASGSTVSVGSFVVNTNKILQLISADLKVRNKLIFQSGCIQLNNHDLIVGNGNAGIITGYNENRFVITNANTSDTMKGFLIRDLVGASNVVFPVGHALGDYTPAIINNIGTPDQFKVRAFDSVYEDGYALNIFSTSSLPASDRSVNRTWDIREGTKGGSNITLTLQYSDSIVSSYYNNRKNHSYISHFVGTYPNNGGDTTSNWKWDLFKYSSTSAPSKPGTITTGSILPYASMKTRSGITSFSPFSITAWHPGATPLPIDLLSFDAKWQTPSDAQINWQVANPEIITSIVLERSIDHGPFEAVQTYNNNILEFTTAIDKHVTALINNTVTYRLRLVENNGVVKYSNKKFLRKNGAVLPSDIVLYPVPAGQQLTISSAQLATGEPVQIEIVNALGQVLLQREYAAESSALFKQTFNIESLATGIYQMNINSGALNLKKKLMVSH